MSPDICNKWPLEFTSAAAAQGTKRPRPGFEVMEKPRSHLPVDPPPAGGSDRQAVVARGASRALSGLESVTAGGQEEEYMWEDTDCTNMEAGGRTAATVLPRPSFDRPEEQRIRGSEEQRSGGAEEQRIRGSEEQRSKRCLLLTPTRCQGSSRVNSNA
uniref:Uncharacterized protein n=1 Tax=Knipowitschia caucasica TaxID=637954 RepID=A0AAV2MAZ3_KNICA